MSDGLTIHEYSDDLAIHFRDINAEWINAMFRLEDTDREVLDNPRAKIIDAGGVILFVEAPGLGIVGTCALQKTGPTGYELTKMGVRESARGLKAGEFLLAAVIQRAMALGADPLYHSPTPNAPRPFTCTRSWASSTTRTSWPATARDTNAATWRCAIAANRCSERAGGFALRAARPSYVAARASQS